MMLRRASELCLLVCCFWVVLVLARRPSESERVELWYAEGNVWPPNWQEESDGMKALMDFREREIMAIPGSDERWENWMQFTQSRLVPKFTEIGFEVVPTPPAVAAKLVKAVEKELENWDAIRSEGRIDVIYHEPGNEPKFASIGALQSEVINDLLEHHESWAGGMKLEPTSAYGVRLYQNGSSLVMHHDKVATHVISSIVHIAHQYDDDNEPWPIQIEDHDGNLHTVNLHPGQMLFYESAKCLHGRMKTFKGKYYGSIFLHYKPVDTSIWDYSVDKVIANVPPHWREGLADNADKGSRWAGAALTVDSRVAEGAPNRIVKGKVLQETTPHDYPSILVGGIPVSKAH